MGKEKKESPASPPVADMTLRDYFAAMVLMGHCQHWQTPSERFEAAHEAYQWAEAMLKAREVKQP